MNKKTLQKIGRNLKEIRQRHRFTQEKLGYHAELDRNWIGKMERGEGEMTLTTLLKLAKAFRMKPDRFLRELLGL